MAKLQTDRFERLAARTYSLKGPGALVDLDETVLGVLQLERQGGMESHFLQGWETFGRISGPGTVAGQFGWIALSNPVGSNRLVVVQSFARASAVPLQIFMSAGVAPGFSAGPTARPLDTRIPGARQPSVRLFTDETATASFGVNIGESATAETVKYETVLGPDGTMLWRTGVVNEAFSLTLRWVERDAAPFEL